MDTEASKIEKEYAETQQAYTNIIRKLYKPMHLHKINQHFDFVSVHKTSSDQSDAQPSIGALSFYLQFFKLKSNQKEAEYLTSLTNENLNYQFLMFWSIQKSSVQKLGGLGMDIVSYDDEPWTDSDLFLSFSYKDANGDSVEPLNFDGSLNIMALNTLKVERLIVKDIVKKAFQVDTSSCNILKNSAANIQSEVCSKVVDPDLSLDYELEVMNCYAIFGMAQNPELCPDISHQGDHGL